MIHDQLVTPIQSVKAAVLIPSLFLVSVWIVRHARKLTHVVSRKKISRPQPRDELGENRG
jgi:hypothetical protein